MTRKETGRVMNILAAAYPRYYSGIFGQRQENALTMWATMFEPDDVRLVCAAVKSFIESDEKGFPPVPGQIKAKIRTITAPDEMTEMEAWGMVAKAIRNSGYDSGKEFAKLPKILRRIVGSSNQLREWSMMDSETVHSVVASNFQRSYKAIAAKEKEIRALPPDVKELVDALRLAQSQTPELPEKTAERLPEPAKREGVTMPESVRNRLAGIMRTQVREPEPATAPKRSREEIIAILRGEKGE